MSVLVLFVLCVWCLVFLVNCLLNCSDFYVLVVANLLMKLRELFSFCGGFL